jgi:hypothetical protein
MAEGDGRVREERESKKLWAERAFCRRDERVKWFPNWDDVYQAALMSASRVYSLSRDMVGQ